MTYKKDFKSRNKFRIGEAKAEEYYKSKLLSWKVPPRWRLDEPDGVAV